MGFVVLFIMLSLYFGAHYLGYWFLLTNFSFFADKINFLRISFLVLSFGFILSFIISHLWRNFFTNFLYIFFGVWVGFLINLLVFVGLFYIVSFLAGYYNLNLERVALVFVGLAFIYSLYGVVNVFYPQVKRVTIEIKDLPSVWENKKIVQLSDVHLGKVLRPNFLARVVDKVNKEDSELIVITGDLFDSTDGPLDVFEPDLNRLKSTRGTYYITGNHEIYLGLGEVEKTIARTNINYLNDKVVNLDGLQLIGANYPQMGEKKDFYEVLRSGDKYSQDKPSILLFHSPTSVLSDGDNNHSAAYFAPDTDFAALGDLDIDLQLSGHTHRGQIFPFNLLTKVIFRGYDYGLKRYGNFQLYTSSGTGVWGPTMRTGSQSEIVVITLIKK